MVTLVKQYAALPTLLVVVSLFAGLVACPDESVGSEYRFRAVAFTGQEGIGWGLGPNLPGGEAFESIIRDPVINNSGDVAFRGFLDSDGGTDESVWSTKGGSLILAAREGDLTHGPGLGDGFFFRPMLDGGFHLADNGDVVLNTTIRGPGISASGLKGSWLFRDGASHVLALPGSVEYGPGLGPAVFDGVSATHSGDHIYVVGGVSGAGVSSTNDWGVWEYTNGSLVNLFRSGEPLTSYSIPGSGFLRSSLVQHDDQDRTYLALNYGPSSSATILGTRFYRRGSSGYELIVGTGGEGYEPLPGAAFTSLSALQVSASGESLAFGALIEGVNVDVDNDSGVWQVVEDTMRLVAREGDALNDPQLGDMTVFGNLAAIDTNDAGMVLLRGRLTGPNVPRSFKDGFWVAHDGALHTVALEGSDAYGPQPGSGASFFSIEDATLDETGAVLFQGWASGGGYNSSNNVGVFRWKNGVLSNVVQKGQLFDVHPDPAVEDLRRIDRIDFSFRSQSDLPDASGTAPFAIRMGFGFNESSSGVFLVTPVPEPASALLAVLGMACCGRMVRDKKYR